ncbi:septum formation family protein [Catellatospora tritici]|uniref:septum formation family protein n=1 Tax=Catellatospora tritici TaxID=2851566 RepID=UPI001C2D33DF|nr:septum formation family protein [Catellatospora tritici]MBV1852773.1 septum formation family protein [Catellatospora tritici]
MTYRRLALIAGAALMFAAGCSSPSAPGDNQADGSPSPSAAAAYEPKVGNCLNVIGGDIEKVAQDREADKVVACTESHDLQIAGVGTLGSGIVSVEDVDKAYLECDKMARKFLGEDWRNGKLEIQVVHDKSANSSDGPRWWECDLIPYHALGSPASTDQDMSGKIPAKLRYTCQTMTEANNEIVDIHDVACSTAHQAEYAGAVVMPVGTKYPADEATWKPVHNSCAAVVAAYVGVSKSSSKLYYYGDVMRGESDWSKRRDVRCFVYFWPKNMTGSAKGTKGKGVPW